MTSHATREPARASWKTPAPVLLPSAAAVFSPLTLIVLPVRRFHTSTLFAAFVDAINAHRWATLFGLRTFIRYDDVALLLKDNKRLRQPGLEWLAASGITDGPLVDWWRLIMVTNDGEVHRRLRGLVNKAFSAHAVESMRSAVDGIVSEYGDELNERGELFAMRGAPFVEQPVGVSTTDPAARAARARLQAVLDGLNPAGGKVEPERPATKKAQARREARAKKKRLMGGKRW